MIIVKTVKLDEFEKKNFIKNRDIKKTNITIVWIYILIINKMLKNMTKRITYFFKINILFLTKITQKRRIFLENTSYITIIYSSYIIMKNNVLKPRIIIIKLIQ